MSVLLTFTHQQPILDPLSPVHRCRGGHGGLQVSSVTAESGQISVEGGGLQIRMIPEGQGTAHLPDVKDRERRNMAKGKAQGAPC